MILAEDEVGLGEDHAGIMVLEDGPEPGTPLADVLPIRDHVLDADGQQGRSPLDGRSRAEVAALLDGELHPPAPNDPEIVDVESVEVAIEDFHGCPRYIGRVFRDVTIGASPQWLRTRLYLADMRSISNVVDVTNYVMHVWGSPPMPSIARTSRVGESSYAVPGKARSCARSTARSAGSFPKIS